MPKSKENCAVCGEPFPETYSKFDADAPVYADEFAYHKSCEDSVFEEVYCEL